MSTQTTSSTDPQRIDDLVRRHHATSLAALSPPVRSQLVQRRVAAGRGESVHRGPALRAGVAAFATLCALAIGLQLRPAAVPGEGDAVPASAASLAAPNRSGSTMLDEDPEFYAWLASSDAQQVAME